jgi:hypothetical protein
VEYGPLLCIFEISVFFDLVDKGFITGLELYIYMTECLWDSKVLDGLSRSCVAVRIDVCVFQCSSQD